MSNSLSDLAQGKQTFGGVTVGSAVALLFAILMLLPDWPQVFYAVYGYPMRDRTVYETMLYSYQLPTDYIREFSLLTYFTQEWLWNWLLAFTTRVAGVPVGLVFAATSAFVLWRFANAVARKAGWPYVILLVNPLVIDFAFSQLRLALAIALVSLVWEGKRSTYLTIAAYIICTSIHTSIIAFAIMHVAAHVFRREDARHLAGLVAVGVMVSLALGPLREPILSLLGDRRAEYPDMSSTLVYLSFWIIAWAALLVDWRRSMQSLDGRYAIVVLSLVFANVFHDGYSTRFIVAAFPSLLISLTRWMPKSANILLLGFVIYSAIQWLYWLRLQ